MENKNKEGRYAYDKISRIIHEKARLSILTSLYANKKGLSFIDLKELCSLSDGNLSRHSQILEKAGLIQIVKGYEGKRPKTDYTITKSGERKYLEYLSELENIIKDALLKEKKSHTKAGTLLKDTFEKGTLNKGFT